MEILGIPNELLLKIGEYLSISDLYHFLLTCRRLKLLLLPRLYKLGLKNIYKHTALQWAARNGHTFLAEQAILGGAEIEKLEEWPGLLWTPLHLAANFGHLGVSSILIEHGANVAAIDTDQQTPLHLAAKSGHSAIIRILIKHGANTNANDCNQQTPLHLAADSGNTAVISTLVEHGADTAANDLNQQTPLHLAANSGYSTVISILVQLGANINASDSNQQTPLHLAVLAKNEEAIEVLLDLGADMLCPDVLKQMPANYAATFGSVGCMKAFINAGFDITFRQPPWNRTDLHDATESNEIDIVQYLLRQERSDMVINAREMDEKLALLSHNSRMESIRLLLQLDTDMGAMSNNEYTPIRLAIRYRKFDCLSAFIDAGFDTNIRAGIEEDSGSTILHEAIYALAPEGTKMIEYLLEQEGGKTIINAQDDYGSTPLHLAASLGLSLGLVNPLDGENQDIVTQGQEKVRLLVQYGADLKMKDNIGNTPAHVTAYRGDIGRMQPLLDCGLDFNSRGLCNRTILHAAVFGGRKMLEYLLSQEGMKMVINAEDAEGSTPLHLATLQHVEKEEMVGLLLHHGANPEEEDDYRAQRKLDFAVYDKEGLARKRLETLAIRCGEKGAIE